MEWQSRGWAGDGVTSDGVDDGPDHVGGFLLVVGLLLDDAVEQLSSRHEFQDHVELVLLVVDLVELDDVRVVDLRRWVVAGLLGW